MKKSKIGVIVVAVVMILLGIGLVCGGVLAVGGMDAAKKSLEEHGVYFDHGFHVDVDHSRKQKTEITPETSSLEPMYLSIDEIRKLDIAAGAANVTIVQDFTSNELTVFRDGTHEMDVKNGVLHIKNQRDMTASELILQIPSKAVFESVEITAGAAQVEIEYLETKELDVEVGAGVVTIQDFQADQAEFDIGAGKVIVDHAGTKECDVSLGMGSFEYHGEILKHGDIECDLGTAQIYLEDAEDAYNYEIECSAAGTVEIGEESYRGVTQKTIDHHAASTIEIECTMGTVNIEF